MTNMATVVQQLRKERDQAPKRIEQLDEALEALIGVGGLRASSGRRSRVNVSATRQPCRRRPADVLQPRSARVGQSGKQRRRASNPNHARVFHKSIHRYFV
jgi:hypothetical protein